MHEQYRKRGEAEKVFLVNTETLGCEITDPYSFFRNVIHGAVAAGINLFYRPLWCTGRQAEIIPKIQVLYCIDLGIIEEPGVNSRV